MQQSPPRQRLSSNAAPGGLSLLEAASLPENYFTVWHNVFERGRLREGEVFLVHGGSSGIGVAAIQLAKVFGATVATTVGNPAKAAFCRDIGADHVIPQQGNGSVLPELRNDCHARQVQPGYRL